MSEHLKLDFLLIEHIAESDSILLGVTLNPAISLVNINGRAHTPNSVVHQILLVNVYYHELIPETSQIIHKVYSSYVHSLIIFFCRMAAAAVALELLTPSVTWAQRSEIIFITINVADVIDPIIEVSCTKHLSIVVVQVNLLTF